MGEIRGGGKQPQQQPHVAVINFPFGSHAAQLLNLTRKLAAAAPHATFSFFTTSKSNSSLFGSSPPSSSSPSTSNIKIYDVDDGLPENHVFSSSHAIEEIEFFIKASPSNFKKGIEKAVAETNKAITCVTNDAFVWMAGDIAAELGVPWVSVYAPGAASLCTHLYTDIIRQKIHVNSNGWYDEPLSFIPGMSKVRAGDLQDGILSGNIESLFACLLHKATQILPEATAVAINSFEELEQPIVDNLKFKFQKCLTVGPFTPSTTDHDHDDDDPNGCLPWLDEHKHNPASVAYISFGTLATPPPNELAALAEGIEASGVPFLWSLKDRVKVHLPNGFLQRTSERGKVVPWAPQRKLLEHPAVGVIVTHCGWNSVLESVMGGVPIIYRPFFGDHKLIGRFVSDIWGIGVAAGDDGVFSKNGVMSALDIILHREEGKRIRDKLGALKQQAMHAIGPSGSSTRNFNTLLEIVTDSLTAHS